MSQAVANTPSLIAKGEPNLLWRQWYAQRQGVSVEHARMVQIAKIRDMPEPALTTGSGNPSAAWSLWYRVQHNVSKNIANRIRNAKIDGTFVPDKRQQRDVDRYLRKVDKEEEKRGSPIPIPRHQHKPFIMLAGEKVFLDGRLGSGEVTLERLGKTKLGRQEIGRLVLLSKEYADIIKAMVGEPTISQ